MKKLPVAKYKKEKQRLPVTAMLQEQLNLLCDKLSRFSY